MKILSYLRDLRGKIATLALLGATTASSGVSPAPEPVAIRAILQAPSVLRPRRDRGAQRQRGVEL